MFHFSEGLGHADISSKKQFLDDISGVRVSHVRLGLISEIVCLGSFCKRDRRFISSSASGSVSEFSLVFDDVHINRLGMRVC